MNSHPFASIVVLLACLAGEEAGWKEFTCKDGGFTVLMPGTPSRKEAETESDFGPGVLHMNTAEAGDSLYGAHYCDFPEGVRKVPLKRVYDSARDGAAENMRGKPAGEEEIKLGGHPGREIRIEVDGGRLLFRSRVVLVGTRLYQVVAFGPKGAATSKETDRFLDSFKLKE